MANVTLTNLSNALKLLYRDKLYNDLTYKRRPLFSLLNKYEGFGGESMPIPLKYGNTQGLAGGGAFTTAQSNVTALGLARFTLTRVSGYSLANIDGEAVEATRGNAHAFIRGLKATIDAAWASLSDVIESQLFRSGTGSLGQVDSVSTVTITLTERGDVYNFEVGQTLVFNDTDGTDAINAGSQAISGINRVDGTLVGAANWTDEGAGTVAASDYIFISGFQQVAAGIANAKCIAGLDAWFPASTTSTSFFGQDRTTDTRLSGVYLDASSLTLLEAGIDAQNESSLNSGAADLWVMHSLQKRRLQKELENKREYREVNARNGKGIVPTISFRSMVIDGDNGPVDVVACPKCPTLKSWMIERGTTTFNTLGMAPKFLREDDAGTILRIYNQDAYETRIAFRGNMGCEAPAHNVHIKMPTP